MNPVAFAFVILSMNSAAAEPQAPPNPPVIDKMAALGTVYVTRNTEAPGTPKSNAKKGAIIGVDFRPMAGTDPKKVAEAVKELSTLPDLEVILLLGMDVNDEAANGIPTSAKITSLQFFNTSVTDAGIAKLGRMSNLQTFKYTGMGLTDEGMKEIAKVKTLVTVEVTDSKISDVGVLALQSLPKLLSLTVENTAATQQSIEQLRVRLPRVEGVRSLR